ERSAWLQKEGGASFLTPSETTPAPSSPLATRRSIKTLLFLLSLKNECYRISHGGKIKAFHSTTVCQKMKEEQEELVGSCQGDMDGDGDGDFFCSLWARQADQSIACLPGMCTFQ
ncbi:unnamed protein product, partial [Discosporangium mesarthrocarpum]